MRQGTRPRSRCVRARAVRPRCAPALRCPSHCNHTDPLARIPLPLHNPGLRSRIRCATLPLTQSPSPARVRCAEGRNGGCTLAGWGGRPQGARTPPRRPPHPPTHPPAQCRALCRWWGGSCPSTSSRQASSSPYARRERGGIGTCLRRCIFINCLRCFSQTAACPSACLPARPPNPSPSPPHRAPATPTSA